METLEKNKVRSFIKEQRKLFTRDMREAWDESILQKVVGLSEIRQAYCVYCYMSMEGEAGTLSLIEALIGMGKYIAVPKVVGKELEFYMIDGMHCLKPGTMGILEPVDRCLRICDPDAPVIVPGLAFDRRGHRIGYGGGYYDRFLEKEPDHKTIGICYGFQMLDALEPEPHDHDMDMIITP